MQGIALHFFSKNMLFFGSQFLKTYDFCQKTVWYDR